MRIWIQIGMHNREHLSLVRAVLCVVSTPILCWRSSPEVSGSFSRQQSAGTRGICAPRHTVPSVNSNCESADWINLWTQTCLDSFLHMLLVKIPALNTEGPSLCSAVCINHISAWRRLRGDLLAVCSYLLETQRREGQTLLKSAWWLRPKATNLLQYGGRKIR